MTTPTTVQPVTDEVVYDESGLQTGSTTTQVVTDPVTGEELGTVTLDERDQIVSAADPAPETPTVPRISAPFVTEDAVVTQETVLDQGVDGPLGAEEEDFEYSDEVLPEEEFETVVEEEEKSNRNLLALAAGLVVFGVVTAILVSLGDSTAADVVGVIIGVVAGAVLAFAIADTE